MITMDTSAWTKIGSSDNAEFYEIEPHVLAIVPHSGSVDSEATARQSIEIQLNYLKSKGRRAGSLIFMDRVAAQDSGARTVYREAPDPNFQICFALVGGTVFGRAVGSVFIGLSPPRVRTKMFSNVDEAIAWVRKKVSSP